jgi:hypothetical protein
MGQGRRSAGDGAGGGDLLEMDQPLFASDFNSKPPHIKHKLL